MDQSHLLDTFRFLEKVSGFNEDTEFDPDDQPYIDTLTQLAAEYQKAAISEDFNKPFLHPMVTVQQHTEELKELVRMALQHG